MDFFPLISSFFFINDLFSLSTLEPQQTSTIIFDIDGASEKIPSTNEESRVQEKLKAFLMGGSNENQTSSPVDDDSEDISLCVSTTNCSPVSCIL